ncbi:NAD(P)-dependent oxidoreductase [Mergibacter septicus]|uniref:NAD-dependent epimerase/dehydratase family protein n=1 Tax=Mergibacter septicus TaxID=221402 RepID=UPI001179772D|nr:NAD-dependent epimerase/dehydratase family protein [Mergibacter septicus]AWX14038.1 NAD(P)-dependent oxidoreductase [Mergibacter septicus]
MKTVAIVGLGWLGFPLARYLKSIGWKIKGSKRTHQGVESMRLRRLECYRLELTPHLNAEPDELEALFDANALIINIPPSRYFFDLEQYVQGVQNLVNEALLHRIEHIIFISSTSIYPQQSGYFDESTPILSDSDVGKALFEIEQGLQQLVDIDVDILRLAGLIGNDRHPVYHLSGKHLQQGNQPVNLVHLTDCLRAIQLLLETPSGHRLYNLTAPQRPTRAEYYPYMATQFALTPPTFNKAINDLQRHILANKICQEMGFVYQYPDPYLMLPEQEQDYMVEV